jgi:hypothetical protein
MILEALDAKFGFTNIKVTEKIKAIQQRDMLKTLLKQIFRVNTLEEFNEVMDKVMER